MTRAWTNNNAENVYNPTSDSGYDVSVLNKVCATEGQCKEQCKHIGIPEKQFYSGYFPDNGCFLKYGKCYWGTGGTYYDKTKYDLQGVRKRVYCNDWSGDSYESGDSYDHDGSYDKNSGDSYDKGDSYEKDSYDKNSYDEHSYDKNSGDSEWSGDEWPPTPSPEWKGDSWSGDDWPPTPSPEWKGDSWDVKSASGDWSGDEWYPTFSP